MIFTDKSIQPRHYPVQRGRNRYTAGYQVHAANASFHSLKIMFVIRRGCTWLLPLETIFGFIN